MHTSRLILATHYQVFLAHMLYTSLTRSALDLFSVDYQQARATFLQQIQSLACFFRHIPFEYPAKGPLNETLFSDCLWLGPLDADKILILISGTHGVEGFAGAAIEADFLQQIQAVSNNLPNGFGVLIIHALNPWGFAWLRRCDHEGIDLNRNFIDFSQSFPNNRGYQELEPYLIPLHIDRQTADQALVSYELKQGRLAYESAMSAGQYTNADAPFYGGIAPSSGRRIIEQLMQEFNLASRRLAVIDLHSGLGPYGYGEIICDHPHNSGHMRTAKKWYGHAVTEPAAGTSSSVPKFGLLDYAWQAIMNEGSCFVTLEFGTFSTHELFRVIRDDHILHTMHKSLEWNAHATQTIKRAIRHHFYPDCDDWKEMVLLRARQVINQALTGLWHAS